MELLTVKGEYLNRLKQVIVNKIKQLHSEQEDTQQGYMGQLKEFQIKLNKVEERFVFEEISQELYDKYAGRLKQEMNDIHKKLQDSRRQVANPESFADRLLNYAQNLREVWEQSDFKDKQKLQNMMFPIGIRYNKKTDKCRTTALNPVFGWTSRKQGDIEVKEKGESPILAENSPLVARETISCTRHFSKPQ